MSDSYHFPPISSGHTYAEMRPCGCTWALIGSGLWVACATHAKGAKAAFDYLVSI